MFTVMMDVFADFVAQASQTSSPMRNVPVVPDGSVNSVTRCMVRMPLFANAPELPMVPPGSNVNLYSVTETSSVDVAPDKVITIGLIAEWLKLADAVAP